MQSNNPNDIAPFLQQDDHPADGGLMPAKDQAKSAGHDPNSVAVNAELTANGTTERAQDADPLQALASEVEAAVLHVDVSADAQVPEVMQLLLLLLPCKAQAVRELMQLECSSLKRKTWWQIESSAPPVCCYRSRGHTPPAGQAVGPKSSVRGNPWS